MDIEIEATDLDAGEGGEKKFYAKENIDNTFCKSSATVNVAAYIAKFAIFDVETTETAAEKNAENILVGTTAAKTLAEGEAYILIEEEGQAVFSICAEGTIAAGKAYLPAPSNAAPALKIVMEDEATAINNLTTSQPHNLTTSTYNLAGQKVSTGYKGIVIRDGKKFVK